MPARDTAPSGAPCWIDLFSSDTDRAAEFYSRIFGWTAVETGPEFGGYVNFTKDGAQIAGMMHNDGSMGVPDAWTTYLSTPDAKQATEAARTAGGQVHLEPHQVAELGTMGLVADPGGAAIGLWQPAAHKGYGRTGEAGAPVWHELHTRDYARVLDFYRTVFGWETTSAGDTDEFRYTQMIVDGVGYAGVMDAGAFLSEGTPSTWQIYIGTEDVDATLEQATALGGRVVEPAMDSPFGRLAKIADPTGATIKLSSLPA